MELLPNLNLTWYKEDLYSDGNVEDLIINLIDKYDTEDYSEAIVKNFSWPVYYHLSELRKNILNWYSFKENCNVLEIGCGMGAITSVLCEKCKHVTAVELSKRRAIATQHRCRNMDNLDIIVGNLNDIEFQDTYDYITLIGVLEYQGKYTDSLEPFKDFLIKIKSLLKPDGKLIIAIENKYGIKYWCGTAEDHTGIPFDGINQYSIGGSEAKTFSKDELIELMKKSGFTSNRFYYPMPDYKFPNYIFTDDYLPKENQLNDMQPYFLDSRTIIADEKKIYPDLIKNKVFDFFANSFFVECGIMDNDFDNAIFITTSNSRKHDYQIQTIIRSDNKVYKKALNHSAINHVKCIHDNLIDLSQSNVHVVNSNYINNIQVSDFNQMPTLEEYMLEQAKLKNKDSIINGFRLLFKNIISSSKHIEDEYTFLHKADILKENVDLGIILQKAYIDMIPKNCFYNGDNLIFFDQEYVYEKVPAKLIIYRGMVDFYSKNRWVDKVCPINLLFDDFKIVPHINIFNSFEKYFLEKVFNSITHSSYLYFRKNVNYSENINKLMANNRKNIIDIKIEIDNLLKKEKIDQAYTLFVNNKLHTIEDQEIAELQKILEIYGYESSKEVDFSFTGYTSLHDMIIYYYGAVSLLKLLVKFILSNKDIDILAEEVRAYGISIYAFYIIIECEFGERDKKILYEFMQSIL